MLTGADLVALERSTALPEDRTDVVAAMIADFVYVIGGEGPEGATDTVFRLNLHEGGIELSVIRQEVGEETEHIEGVYTGEEMTIAFNTRYLTEGVNAIDSDTIILETIDALKPGLLHGEGDEDFRYLLMPVRL